MRRKEVYVMGFSCRFPESNSPYEFFENLLSQRDMIRHYNQRWPQKIDEIPERYGQIKQDLSCFDYKFFALNGKVAEKMDPQLRLLLETSYEALVDAGIDLELIKGSNTGVYIGAFGGDASSAWTRDPNEISGYETLGCAPTMLANRLSFFYDLHGPSETVDTACSSSLVALHNAISDIENGVCDYAIVGGSSMILLPTNTFGLQRLKMLSPDGACKSFDQSANGFARAEGVASLILSSKKGQSYRPYAKILGSATGNGGWNSTGITFPNGKMQRDLYRTVCKKASIHPKEVDYIEAHGTGTLAGDGEELDAIYSVYGKENRNLVIGSVKSNMGHTEGASGLAGLIKILLSFDQETIPPNIHLNRPNKKLRHMQVRTSPLKFWQGKKAAVSSFGFGGTNAHVIVEKYPKEEEKRQNSWNLTLLAHRTKEGLYGFKNALLESGMINPSFVIPNSSNRQKLPYREVLELPDAPEECYAGENEDKIYIICSGNGSQWKGMGLKFYATFPTFKQIIDACGQAVQSDLFKLLSDGWNDSLDATLALVSIQLGLIELLRSFGLHSKKIGGFLGHSAGEICCSYLDSLTSLEETMKIAYARGFIAQKTGDLGLMAALGVSKEEMEEMIQKMGCLDDVTIACINSPRNVTISGRKDAILRVIGEANRRDIFNRVLDTYGKAYHSHFFHEHKDELEQLLSVGLAGKSGKRSERWLTTIENHKSTLFDAFYHIEGVLKPVDFMEAIKKIPQNQIVLEIGPHSILKGIVKDNRPDLRYVSLMKKESDELQTLKEGLGQLWRLGIYINVPQLHARPQRLPLHLRGKLCSWDYVEKFPYPTLEEFQSKAEIQQKITYTLSQGRDLFLKDHIVDGKMILPATSYLCALWEAFRKKHNLQITDSVTYSFSDFEIFQIVQVQEDLTIEFSVKNFRNQYELIYKEELIAKAKINTLESKVWEPLVQKAESNSLSINENQFYRIMHSAGYGHTGKFRVVKELFFDYKNNRSFSSIKWENNWITFLDGFLQLQLLMPKSVEIELRVPVKIESISINPHLMLEGDHDLSNLKRAVADFDLNSVRCAGIEILRTETKDMNKTSGRDVVRMDTKYVWSTLQYGLNLNMNPSIHEYCRSFVNFAISSCRNLIRQQGLQDQGHYKRVMECFDKWQKFEPTDIEPFGELEEASYLRMVKDIYQFKRKEFLENPLLVITQHPEHEKFYIDPISTFNCKYYLNRYLSVVRENTNHPNLNILEIGAGTGSMTRMIAPCIYNDRYILTDITEAFMGVEDETIRKINTSYEKFNINFRKDFEKLKEYSIDLVVASNSMHTGFNIDQSLKGLYENLKEGAFGVIYEATSPCCIPLWGMDKNTWQFEDEREYGLWISLDHWLKKLKNIGFEVISYVTDPDEITTMFLIRKPVLLSFKSVLEGPQVEHFDQWANKIKGCEKPVLLVANTINHSGVDGFIRSLNREEAATNYYCVSTDQELNAAQMEEIRRFGLTINVLENGKLGTVCTEPIRFTRLEERHSGSYLKFLSYGDISNHCWASNNGPLEDETVCTVKYASLNFRDVMQASGKIDKSVLIETPIGEDASIGLEFSGHDALGNRYMCVGRNTIATKVNCKPFTLIPIPDDLSYEDAATIPLVYATVYYALFVRANIQQGQSILIHAGAGGVGQAAIRVCHDLECKIFVTCHKSKRSILKNLFPFFDEDSIFDSRSVAFENQMIKRTNGRGVDIVLNSLADEKLQASLRCVAQHGYFIELGKYDIMKHHTIDMNFFKKDISFHGIDFEQIFLKEGKLEKVVRLLQDGMRRGVIKPLPRHVFKWTEAEEAFRFMAAGKHTGKVLINMEGASEKLDTPQSPSSFWHDPKDKGYYLVTGGLGGFGMSLINSLFKKGVRKFLITSKRGVSSAEQERLLFILRSRGAEVIVSTKDVAKFGETQELIDSIGGKISAVFHLAMSLEDSLFENMTKEKWETIVDIKAKGAKHLDLMTRNPSIKHFFGFSSGATAYGNMGQSNYAFGNGVMENICKERLKAGFPALAIQWGSIADVGFLANHLKTYNTLSNTSVWVSPIPITEALRFIDQLLTHKVNGSCTHFSAVDSEISKSKDEMSKKLTVQEIFAQINHVVRMDLSKCNENDTLRALGLDSLQTVEIQTILIKSVQEVLPLKKISTMELGELKQFIEIKLETGIKKEQSQELPIEQNREDTLIYSVNSLKGNKDVVYLFFGFGVDPSKVVIPKTDKFNIKVVAWHDARSVDEVARAISADLKNSQYRNVTFLTHSIAYQISRAVLSKMDLKVNQLVSISIVNDRFINDASNIKSLSTISDEIGEKMYRDFAFYTKDHLPIGKIKKQSMFLASLGEMQSISPDIAIIPKRDPVCDRNIQGIGMDGDHEISSIDMNEVFAKILYS